MAAPSVRANGSYYENNMGEIIRYNNTVILTQTPSTQAGKIKLNVTFWFTTAYSTSRSQSLTLRDTNNTILYTIGDVQVGTAWQESGAKTWSVELNNAVAKSITKVVWGAYTSATVSMANFLESYSMTLTKDSHVQSASVNRTFSDIGSTGNISSGSIIYRTDVLEVAAVAATGYTLSGLTSPITVSGNVNIALTTTLSIYHIFVTTDTAVQSYSLTRTQSAFGSTGNISTSSSLYEGDVIVVNAVPKTGYTLVNIPRTITVYDDIYVNISSVLAMFKLIITPLGHCTIIVENNGVELHDGDDILLGDTLTVTRIPDAGYILSGYSAYETINVTSNVVVKGKAVFSRGIYIPMIYDNGTWSYTVLGVKDE